MAGASQGLMKLPCCHRARMSARLHASTLATRMSHSMRRPTSSASLRLGRRAPTSQRARAVQALSDTGLLSPAPGPWPLAPGDRPAGTEALGAQPGLLGRRPATSDSWSSLCAEHRKLGSPEARGLAGVEPASSAMPEPGPEPYPFKISPFERPLQTLAQPGRHRPTLRPAQRPACRC